MIGSRVVVENRTKEGRGQKQEPSEEATPLQPSLKTAAQTQVTGGKRGGLLLGIFCSWRPQI